jgi:hypothetical protein
MGVTSWSAPSSPQQGDASLTTSSFTTATLTDISPAPCIIPGGTVISGTRIRLHATGNYTATTTASALKWGFYLTASGSAISATASAAVAETASTAAVVATAWPFILDYSGVFNEVSVSQNATSGKITGQGWSLLPASLTTFTGPIPMPMTAAARTVTQSSTITGLNTLNTLIAMLGITVATNTGFSNVVVDELTCELIG